MKRPWMPLYIADFIRDTTHVGPLIKGAYLCLIMHYWNHGSLPDDEAKLRTITGLSPQEWRYHHDTLKAFFRNGWKHKRIDHELAHVADISNKRSAVAAARQEKLRLQNECKQSAIAPPFAGANAPTLHTTQSKEDAADAAPSKYEFESGVIKLNQKTFDQWTLAYEFVSLRAELLALTKWAGEQREWFFAVQQALAKKNREAKIKSQQPAKPEFKWKSGIEGVY